MLIYIKQINSYYNYEHNRVIFIIVFIILLKIINFNLIIYFFKKRIIKNKKVS